MNLFLIGSTLCTHVVKKKVKKKAPEFKETSPRQQMLNRTIFALNFSNCHPHDFRHRPKNFEKSLIYRFSWFDRLFSH